MPPYPQPERIQPAARPGVMIPPLLYSQSLKVSPQGGVQNALVIFVNPPEEKTGAKGVAVLNQKDYHFDPHVLVIYPGQSFQIKNSDSEAHDVRAFDGPAMLFRFEMQPGAAPVEKNWEHPGMYVIRCGVHRWMNAYVFQAAHSFYAVTGPEGDFRLKDVPAGTYTLRIWHETLGQADVSFAVTNSESLFTYTFSNQGV